MSARDMLRAPPRMIDPLQRVKYTTISALTEMAEVAFEDIRELAQQYVDQSDDANDNYRNNCRLMSLAWSVIDQADLLRHLISSEGEAIQISEAAAFQEIAKDFNDVRVWMRHIPQRVEGYLQRRQPVPPILGALSFSFPVRVANRTPLEMIVPSDRVIEFHTVVVTNTSFERQGGFSGEPISFQEFRYPVDHFYLQAFGKNISLEQVVSSMRKFATAMASGIAQFVQTTKEAYGLDDDQQTPAYESDGTYRMIAKRD
jgi:hypothetical protein